MARRRLKTASDVRRYLASLIHRIEDGTLEPEKAAKACYVSTALLKAIETATLETRLEELEQSYVEFTRKSENTEKDFDPIYS